MIRPTPLFLICSIVGALTLAGCPAEPGEDAGPPAPPTEEDLVDAYVELFLRCSEWGPDSFLSELEPELALTVREDFEELLRERVQEIIDNPNVEVNEDKLEGCIDWANNAPCGEEPDDAECEDVLFGTIEVDGPCLQDSECASGFCHMPPDDPCGTCRAVGAQGDDCREVAEGSGDVSLLRCEDGLYCNGTSGQCEPKLGQGANCLAASQCQEDHVCIGLPQTCRAVTSGEAAGDPCLVTNQAQTCGGVQITGLRCEGTNNQVGLCVAVSIVGENGTCDGQIGDNSSLWCERGLTENYCVVPEGADVGVCGPLPSTGDPCIDSGGRCKNDSVCVVTDTNPLDPQAGCVAAPEAGDACLEGAVSSDGCSTVGNFLSCDGDETEPMCVATPLGGTAEEQPVCEM